MRVIVSIILLVLVFGTASAAPETQFFEDGSLVRIVFTDGSQLFCQSWGNPDPVGVQFNPFAGIWYPPVGSESSAVNVSCDQVEIQPEDVSEVFIAGTYFACLAPFLASNPIAYRCVMPDI